MDPTPSHVPYGHSMSWSATSSVPAVGGSTSGTTHQQPSQQPILGDGPLYASAVTNSPYSSKKSRISRACDTCRKKKIRCDVDNCQPCTTCRQYEWECTFNDTARKRGPPKGYIEGLEARLERMEQLLSKVKSDNLDNDAPIHATTAPHTPLPHPSTAYQQVGHTMTTTTVAGSSLYSPSSSSSSYSGNAQLPPKDKVVRYLGSSSGLYMVNDILTDNGHGGSDNGISSNGSDSSRSTIAAQYGTPQAPENVSPWHGPTSSTSIASSSLPSTTTSSSKRPAQDTESDDYNSNTNYTSIETRQGTVRLRRMNSYDDDFVMVRDETEDETKARVAAAHEQDTMESIVPRRILASLINIYFAADCTTLPMLDKEEFVDSFEGKTTPPPAPLLTYAICSFACFLVPSNHSIFTQSGNSLGRNQVFHALVERAALFIRSEHLIPRIQTIQALVLLCAHPTYNSGSYRNWILAGMAVRMAQDLGLHRLVTNPGITADAVEKRRRLWYSVYTTDRWCCSVMGRPLAIADSDCDVDLPSVDAVGQPGKYVMFVNLIKLSGILGEVLRRVYSPKAKAMGYATHIMEQTVWSLDKMLKEWLDNVPPGYIISQDHLRRVKGVEYTLGNLFKSGGPLTVCYYAVVVLLFRPFIVFECGKYQSSRLFDEAPKRCMEAAMNAIDVARHIPEREIARYGWNFAAYSVIQASLIHVYNCTNDDPAIAQTSRDYVRTSIDECVAPMTKDIPFGPPAVQFMENLLRLMKVNTSTSSRGQQPTSLDNRSAPSPIPETHSSQTAQGIPPPPYLPPYYADMYYPPTASLQTIPNTPINVSRMANEKPSYSVPPVNPTASNLLDNYDPRTHQPSLSALPRGSTYNSDAFTSNPVDIINMALNGDPLLDSSPNATMTQATWQHLFTSAGTPFTGNTHNDQDFGVSLENVFMENQSTWNTNL